MDSNNKLMKEVEEEYYKEFFYLKAKAGRGNKLTKKERDRFDFILGYFHDQDKKVKAFTGRNVGNYKK